MMVAVRPEVLELKGSPLHFEQVARDRALLNRYSAVVGAVIDSTLRGNPPAKAGPGSSKRLLDASEDLVLRAAERITRSQVLEPC